MNAERRPILCGYMQDVKAICQEEHKCSLYARRSVPELRTHRSPGHGQHGVAIERIHDGFRRLRPYPFAAEQIADSVWHGLCCREVRKLDGHRSHTAQAASRKAHAA